MFLHPDLDRGISHNRSWKPHKLAHCNFISMPKLSLIQLLLQHCIAFRLELVSRFPFGKFVAINYFVTHFEYELNILHGAGEVPIGTNFVGDLVVICRVIIVGLEWRGLGTGEKMFAFAYVKRGQADLREFEIVSAINLALVRPAVWD